jgi:carbon storage regulator
MGRATSRRINLWKDFPIILGARDVILQRYELGFQQRPLTASETGSLEATTTMIQRDTTPGGLGGEHAMLVLTRKLMEKLYIGENICVTVVRLEGGQVRLGIEAPLEVPVVRAELVPDRRMSRPRPAEAVAAAEPDVRFQRVAVRETDTRRRARFR